MRSERLSKDSSAFAVFQAHVEVHDNNLSRKHTRPGRNSQKHLFLNPSLVSLQADLEASLTAREADISTRSERLSKDSSAFAVLQAHVEEREKNLSEKEHSAEKKAAEIERMNRAAVNTREELTRRAEENAKEREAVRIVVAGTEERARVLEEEKEKVKRREKEVDGREGRVREAERVLAERERAAQEQAAQAGFSSFPFH
jgi:DNA repair exonuclease SbcCD ATPase subunit